MSGKLDREEIAVRYLTERIAYDLREHAPAEVTVVDAKSRSILVDVKGQKVMVGLQACE